MEAQPTPSVDIKEKQEKYEAAASELQETLGEMPVEFATAGELMALLSRIPADTPVKLAWCLREPPRTNDDDLDNDRLTAAVHPTRMEDVTVLRRPDGYITTLSWPVAAVSLGAFLVPQHRPVPTVTVPANPYDRAVEAMHDGDDEAMFAAYREMLNDIADGLDGAGDASLYETITDPAIIERAEAEAQLLRDAAARLGALYTRIERHLHDRAG